jgi:hypothetical protein
MEFVSPVRLSTSFLSFISASDAYSFQYTADVSPYSATLDYSLSAKSNHCSCGLGTFTFLFLMPVVMAVVTAVTWNRRA